MQALLAWATEAAKLGSNSRFFFDLLSSFGRLRARSLNAMLERPAAAPSRHCLSEMRACDYSEFLVPIVRAGDASILRLQSSALQQQRLDGGMALLPRQAQRHFIVSVNVRAPV